MTDFEIKAFDVTIKPTFSHKCVDLSFGADIDDVAKMLTAKQIVDNVDVDDLLDAIGEERAASYFGLVQAE